MGREQKLKNNQGSEYFSAIQKFENTQGLCWIASLRYSWRVATKVDSGLIWYDEVNYKISTKENTRNLNP